MLTTEERRKLRDEKVKEALSKQPKQKPKRKPGPRPAGAKMMPAPPEPKKAQKPSKKPKK